LAVVLLVSLVPAVLLVLGPLAFLVLLPSEAGVLAFMVGSTTFTGAAGTMLGTLRQLTGTAAWAMPTAMDRGEAATGHLMASTPTAVPTLATANTPTSTATDCTHKSTARVAEPRLR